MADGFLRLKVRDLSFLTVMKYHLLHLISRTSTPCKEKSPDHFKDLYKLTLLKNFDVNMTSSPV